MALKCKEHDSQILGSSTTPNRDILMIQTASQLSNETHNLNSTKVCTQTPKEKARQIIVYTVTVVVLVKG